MEIIHTDVAIVGAGGAGLRAAIEIARAAPDKTVHLISKAHPMRSHTAAEGGSAGVVRDDDSLENHFNDTVSGGDWLCEQDVVQYFVVNATEEMIQLEHWGCPWSRLPDGRANVRRFGGMKIPRTWFAATQNRLPHAAHAVSNLAAIPEYSAFRRTFRAGFIGGQRPVARRVVLRPAKTARRAQCRPRA